MARTDFMMTWRLTDHCCAYCGGRILTAVDDEQHVRCADCGAEDTGVKSICWCGAGEQLGDAPITIHCGANPNPTGSNLAQIVAIEGPPVANLPARNRTSAGR